MAILAIAHNRMTDVGHVDADLILAACEQVKEQQRAIFGLLYEFPLGTSPLAAVIDRTPCCLSTTTIHWSS